MDKLTHALLQKVFVTLLLIYCSSAIVGQAPEKFQYQTVIRDNNGDAVTTEITLRFSVHEETAGGTVVFQETHTVTPNEFGLVSLQIGGGTPVVATLNGVNWGGNTYFMEVEMNDGSGYVNMGTTQMLSVPYAMEASHAATSDSLQLTSPDGTIYSLSVDNAGNLTANETGIFIDSRDGHEYSYVAIGDQIWMGENLAYLPEVSYIPDFYKSGERYYIFDYYGQSTTEAKLSNNYKDYGVLYNLDAAKSACPDGWRLPGAEEWEILANLISVDNDDCYKEGDDWLNVGKYLKIGEYNNYGFSAVGGGRFDGNEFRYIENSEFWTSSVLANGVTPIYYDITGSNLNRSDNNTFYGFSVRCIKETVVNE